MDIHIICKHSFSVFFKRCKDVSIFSTRTGRDQRGAAVEARFFDGGPGQSDAYMQCELTYLKIPKDT